MSAFGAPGDFTFVCAGGVGMDADIGDGAFFKATFSVKVSEEGFIADAAEFAVAKAGIAGRVLLFTANV